MKKTLTLALVAALLVPGPAFAARARVKGKASAKGRITSRYVVPLKAGAAGAGRSQQTPPTQIVPLSGAGRGAGAMK